MPERGNLGIGHHTDAGALTILDQADIPGPQVLQDNRWVNVPVMPGCFTVNIGDVVQVWRVGDTFAMAGYFAIAVALLVVIIAVLGWVEDVAARRPIRLLPWSVVLPSRPRPATPEWSGPIWF